MRGRVSLMLIGLAALAAAPPGCAHGTGQASADRAGPDTEIIEQRWPDGSLRLRKEVLRKPDGTLINHGTYTRWHNNGVKEYETTFVHGAKQGRATRWHRNGRIWTEEQYQDGKRHGISRTWDANGVLRKEENHREGRPDGTWTVWDKQGRIKSQRTRQDADPLSQSP